MKRLSHKKSHQTKQKNIASIDQKHNKLREKDAVHHAVVITFIISYFSVRIGYDEWWKCAIIKRYFLQS